MSFGNYDDDGHVQTAVTASKVYFCRKLLRSAEASKGKVRQTHQVQVSVQYAGRRAGSTISQRVKSSVIKVAKKAPT